MRSLFKRAVGLALINSVLFSAVGYAAVTSRPIGNEEKIIEKHEIYTQNQNNLRTLFVRSGGNVSKIIQDNYPVISFSSTETVSRGDFWFGPGYFRNPSTDETLGLTNRNYKYAKLTMDIKLENAKAYDNLSINFGYVPKHSSEYNTDFTWFGRFIKNDEEIDSYVDAITEWQKIEIPLSVFKSVSTNKYCIPGTESWTYELLDWSKFNLIGFFIDENAESRNILIRNIYLSYPKFLGCTAEYELVDEDSLALDTMQSAQGKKVYGTVKYNNKKTTDEKMLVMLLEYKDDKMIKIKSCLFTAAAGTNGKWKTPEFIEADGNGETEIRMLVWDYTDGMRSAGPAEILR